MIDVGRPFSKSYRSLVEALEESIREGVPQPVQERIVFRSNVTSYELQQPVDRITRVSGLGGGGTFVVYTPGVHYRRSDNRLVWIHPGEKPSDGARLTVEYTYRERPAGLTDFNPGSVVGTLLRAVAREMKLVYDQMDEAYRRAFVDYASGVALDNVVALLGLARNEATAAEGHVTFFRKTAADQRYLVPAGTEVTDEGGRAFVTTAPGAVDAEPVDELHRHEGGVVTVDRRIAALVGVWPDADDPEVDDPLETEPTTPEAPFGDDEATVTLSDAEAPEHLLVRYVARSVTVPVAAVEPGPEGNVNAETITIMPTPPAGIQGVVNAAPVAGGRPAETDEQLRQRARFHLERLGNATRNALRFAVLEVDGVDGVEVADHSVDGAIPLGEVRVSYAGGRTEEVRRAVEATRAAGVLAVLSEIEEILVEGTWHVIAEPDAPAGAVAAFRQAVADALAALEIGAPLSARRLNALAYAVPGVADVAEAELRRTGETAALPDPFVVGRTQVVRPDAARLDVRALTALDVDGPPARVGATNEVTLRVLTAAGPASFEAFTLDVTVTVRARLATAPDQPPSFLGTLTDQVTFSGGTTAVLAVADAALEGIGFDAGTHAAALELSVAATAYPGLDAVVTTIEVS